MLTALVLPLLLLETRTVTVSVVDHAGAPVADAAVQVRYLDPGTEEGVDRTTSTDDRGLAKIELSEPQAKAVLINVTAAGRPSARHVFRQSDGRTPRVPHRLDYRLAEPTTFSGTVSDIDGSPVVGATVGLISSVPRTPTVGEPLYIHRVEATLTTDVGGVWTCDSVPAAAAGATLFVRHPDFVRSEEFLRDGQSAGLRDGSHETVLDRGTAVRLRAVGPAEEPVEGAFVLFDRSRSASELAVKTDAEGRADLARMPRGKQTLVVARDGYAPVERDVELTDDVQDITVRLDHGYTLTVRAVDEDGEPVPDAAISYSSSEMTMALMGLFGKVWDREFDETGTWTWHDAPAGGQEFSVRARGYVGGRGELLKPRDEPHVVTLRRPVVFDLRVSDAATGEPLTDWTLTPGTEFSGRLSWSNWMKKRVTSESYRHAVDHTSEGYAVRVEAEGYVPFVSRVLRLGDGEVRVDAALKPAEATFALAEYADGSPAAGAVLYFPTAGDRIYVRATGVDEASGKLRRTADADGRFAVPPLTENYHVLSLGPAGFGHATKTQLEETGRITVEPWARVEGVFRRGGKPLPRQDLSISFSGGPQSEFSRVPYHFDYDATTDSAGRFVIDRMPPGDFRIAEDIVLQTTRSGRMHAFGHHTSATAVAGETVELDFPPAGTRVFGRLRLPDGVNGNAGQSALKRTRSDQYRFRVAADGTFEIPDVPPGEYTLRLRIARPPYAGLVLNESDDDLRKDVPVTVKAGAAELDLGAIDLR